MCSQLVAKGCPKDIAQAIVDKGANYVLGLKGNQGTLSDRVKAFFDQTEWRNHDSYSDWGTRAKEKGHGRVETRRCVALACDHWDGIDAWEGLKRVVMIESIRQTESGVSLEKRHYISSLAPASEKLAHAIRSHWEVENRLHWCLDVTFGEDASRIREDHAP